MRMNDREPSLTPTPKQRIPKTNPATRCYIGPNCDSSILLHVHPKEMPYRSRSIFVDQKAMPTSNPILHRHIISPVDLKINLIT